MNMSMINQLNKDEVVGAWNLLATNNYDKKEYLENQLKINMEKFNSVERIDTKNEIAIELISLLSDYNDVYNEYCALQSMKEQIEYYHGKMNEEIDDGK